MIKDNTGENPHHVAIIMDGNGRWAEAQGQIRTFGHAAGKERAIEVAKHAREQGVRVLTVYAFSDDNWKRPQEEVDFLMELLSVYIEDHIEKADTEPVRVRFLGNRTQLPQRVQELMKKAEEVTAHHEELILQISLSYGGRNEIARAATKINQKMADGELHGPVTEEMIIDHLDTSGVPDPDLIIRTGKECRLSNFLPWQGTHAELLFVDTMWPDFGPDEFDAALAEFRTRQRRRGKISAQVV